MPLICRHARTLEETRLLRAAAQRDRPRERRLRVPGMAASNFPDPEIPLRLEVRLFWHHLEKKCLLSYVDVCKARPERDGPQPGRYRFAVEQPVPESLRHIHFLQSTPDLDVRTREIICRNQGDVRHTPGANQRVRLAVATSRQNVRRTLQSRQILPVQRRQCRELTEISDRRRGI